MPAAKPKTVDPDSRDNALHPVEGNPAACPPPLCGECFPGGWPAEVASVGCAHGMWIRQWPPPPPKPGRHERTDTAATEQSDD